MIERLPTPWGLVRLGVAPDHPKLKAVSRAFEKIAARPGFRFLGNVEVGTRRHARRARARCTTPSSTRSARRPTGSSASPARTFPAPGRPPSSSPGTTATRTSSTSSSTSRASERSSSGTGTSRSTSRGCSRSRARSSRRPTRPTPAIEAIVAVGHPRDRRARPARPGSGGVDVDRARRSSGELAGADVVVDPAELELDPASAAELETASNIVQRNVESSASSRLASRPGSRVRFGSASASRRSRSSARSEVEASRSSRNRLEADASGRVRAVADRRARDHPVRDRLSQRRLPRRRGSRARRSTSARARCRTRAAASSTSEASRSRASTARAGSSAARPESSGRTRRTRPRRSTSCSRTRARADSPEQARPASTTSSPSEASRSSRTRAGRRSTRSSAPEGRSRAGRASSSAPGTSSWQSGAASRTLAHERLERRVDVGSGVVDVPRRAQPPAAHGRLDPGARELLGGVRRVRMTIAESPGSRPRPARKRLARATSCSWIASTPICSITASVGAVATHMNQAGDVSSLRALSARRSGGPKNVA